MVDRLLLQAAPENTDESMSVFAVSSCRGISPEGELLLASARLPASPELDSRIRLLANKPLDWGRFLSLTGYHAVVPLVHRTLRRVDPMIVPQPFRSRLEGAMKMHLHRNLFLTASLIQLFQLLRRQGIPVLPYKGPVLATFVYGHASLRQFADLDLIVPPDSFDDALRILKCEGLEPQLNGQPNVAGELRRKDCCLVRPQDLLRVELHWAPVPAHIPLQIPETLLWGEQQQVEVAGTSFPCPSVDALFLLLCVHGTRHRWERLGWICDVAELIRRHPSKNLDSLHELAARLGLERAFLLGLFLAADMLGAPIPRSVLPRLRPVRRLARLVAGQFERPETVVTIPEKLLFTARCADSLRSRMIILRHYLRAVS